MGLITKLLPAKTGETLYSVAASHGKMKNVASLPILTGKDPGIWVNMDKAASVGARMTFARGLSVSRQE